MEKLHIINTDLGQAIIGVDPETRKVRWVEPSEGKSFYTTRQAAHRRRKQLEDRMLTWNNETRAYEGKVDGYLVEIDGDVFAETEQEMRATYMNDGMSADQAEQKAWSELNDAARWYGDYDGVTITKIEK